jgi:hypothetical protein
MFAERYTPAHLTATVELHIGSFNFVRPSMGAGVVCGLGRENPDLPGFITINPIAHRGFKRYLGPSRQPAPADRADFLTDRSTRGGA